MTATSAAQTAQSLLAERRGQTAVLGSGHVFAPAEAQSPAVERGVSERLATSSLADGAARYRTSETSQNKARGVGRRKLQRRENARLSSNPHLVRPSLRDYALRHNEHTSHFPLSNDTQRAFKATSSSSVASDGSKDRLSAEHGVFSMSYSDANWFLSNRLGVQAAELSRIADRDLGPVQRFAKAVQSYIRDWLEQDLFFPSKPRALLWDEIDSDERDSDRQRASSEAHLQLWEWARNEQNLVWRIDDAFLRLVIHCIARTLGCGSFSKASSSDDSAQRDTWILKNRKQQQRIWHARVADMDTPPATDAATDTAVSDSHSTLDGESDWVHSDVEEERGEGEGNAADTRHHRFDNVGEETILPYRIEEDIEGEDVEEEDVAALADIE